MAQAQAVEGLGLGEITLGLDLVHHQEDGLVDAAQFAGDGLVLGGDAGADVDHEDHRVGALHGLPRDRRDRFVEHALVAEGNDAAGVDQHEPAPVPIGGMHVLVAGHTRLGRDHGLTLADDPVEERGLAHVRPSDDGHHGQAHAARSAATENRVSTSPSSATRTGNRERSTSSSSGMSSRKTPS